jgi:hypothetical protein
MQKPGILAKIKSQFVSGKRKVRRMKGGLLKGLNFPLNLKRQSQVYLGLYERETHGWIQKLTTAIRTFIDAGANNGQLTTFALLRTKAEQVLAFEPETFQHEWIRKAIHANGGKDAEQLKIYPFFLGSKDNGTVRTVDSFGPKIEYPCFLKVDVEGGEVDLLRGAKETLRGGDCRLVVETHTESKEQECIALLKELGYTVEIIPNAWWRAILPEDRPLGHNRWLAAYVR